MTAIALNDLNLCNELDSIASTAIAGAGAWHRRGASISTGSFGAYRRTSQSYQGIRFHDGYLQRHYIEGWMRQRTQTEYSSWDHNVRV